MTKKQQLAVSLPAPLVKAFVSDFGLLSHDHQLPPETDWSTWLLLGGRGAGKTRAGAEWVRGIALGIKPYAERPVSPIALVGETEHDARDEVNYIGVDINTRILKGMNHATKAVRKPGLSAMADPHYCHDIYTAKSLPPDETRLVQTKELLQILDPDAFKTATGAEFEKMIQGVVLPPGTLSVVKNGIQAAWDMGSITAASAVLLPLAARNLLLPKLNEGKLTIAEIAGMADIPIDSVKVVMSPRWDEIYDGLINLNWPEPPAGPDPSGIT